MLKRSGRFSSTGVSYWRWPLMVGIDPALAGELDLASANYIKQFTRIGILQAAPARANIWLVRELENAYDLSSRLDWKFDIIIVFDDRKNIEGVPEFQLLKSWTRHSGALGLFILPYSTDLVAVFNEILIRLSHDLSVMEAIDSFSGFFYGDEERINQELRLTHLIRQMSQELQTFPNENLQINLSRIFPGNTFDTNSLINLFNDPGTLSFLHESDGASDIVEIYQKLSDYYKTGVFKKISPITKGEDKPKYNYLDGPLPGMEETNMDTGDQHFPEENIAPVDVKPGNDPDDSYRFLQFLIHDKDNPHIPRHYLLQDQSHFLNVEIAYPTKGWTQAPLAVDTDKIFEDSYNEEEPVDIVVRTPENPAGIKRTISLPRYGNSTRAVFELLPGHSSSYNVIIEAYHHNKLLQMISFNLVIYIDNLQTNYPDKIDVNIIYNIGKEIFPLKNATEYAASYILLEEEKDGETVAGLAGMNADQPVPLFFSPELSRLMDEIRSIIEDATKAADKDENKITDITYPGNDLPLVRLALTGNDIFVNHLDQKKLNGPLKIVTNRPGFAPIDFVYDFAAPDVDATVCPNARKALQDGFCKDCSSNKTVPAKHVCPLGFWGLRQVIARSAEKDQKASGDYFIKKIQPTENDRVLEILVNPLHGFATRADNIQNTSSQQVRDAIQQYSTNSGTEVKAWEKWLEETEKTNPDSMILIVHVENNARVNKDQLEIGDQDFLLQNYFDTKYVKPQPNQRSPLMIIIGCKTSDPKKWGFDISSKLIQEGAAVVISNFTRISGRNASAMVVELLKAFKEAGDQQLLFGNALLKARQRLMANGVLTALSLTGYGDADWKFKTLRHV